MDEFHQTAAIREWRLTGREPLYQIKLQKKYKEEYKTFGICFNQMSEILIMEVLVALIPETVML